MEILRGVGPVLWLGNAELGEDETVELILWLALIIDALVPIHDIEIEVLVRLLLDGGVGVVCLNNGGEMFQKRCANLRV